MRVIPAIDLYEGRVVRFESGKKEKCHFYNHDPVQLLTRFVEEGFTLVHIVDLSAAMDGSRVNEPVLEEISDRNLAQFVQIGGGIRSVERSLWLARMGFKRQILSSMLIERPSSICELLDFGVEVVFSLDTFGEQVRLKGWKETSELNAVTLLKELKRFGLSEVVHTDVRADGTLTGRDLSFTKLLAVETHLTFIVAGGIASVKDLENVKRLNVEVPNVNGVIVGRAFYEGSITLEEMKAYAR